MSVFEIKSKQDIDRLFKSAVKNIIIDHYADWCAPCKYLTPKFEELSKQFSSHETVFARCNAETNLFQVDGLPTIEFYGIGRKLVDKVMGADVEQITRSVKKLLNGGSDQRVGGESGGGANPNRPNLQPAYSQGPQPIPAPLNVSGYAYKNSDDVGGGKGGRYKRGAF